MRFPKPLPVNGTIGFAAPSFGCATEPYRTAFDNALRKWREAGYGIELGPNCYEERGIGISSTPEACAGELEGMYCDDECDVIISCGGGELMCETISQINFAKIKKADPKWYLGYSDNTNFTFLLTTICDTAAIYGPCAASFGMSEEHRSLRDAMSVLTLGNEPGDVNQTSSKSHSPKDPARHISFSGYERWERNQIKDESNPLAGYNLERDSYVRAYQPHGEKYAIGHMLEAPEVNMRGRLVGGCMDCLVNLCGTRFDKVKEFNKKYADDGIIWFLESCDLNVMGMRRAMWELEEAGWFKNAAGFIIGRPAHFDEPEMGLDQYKAIYDVVSHYEVPLIMDADLGHLPPTVPMISGAMAQVHAEGGKWNIEMELA